jgi:hypothetical protein
MPVTISRARRPAQLPVQQGYHMPLGRQPARQIIGAVLLNSLLQLMPRHML